MFCLKMAATQPTARLIPGARQLHTTLATVTCGANGPSSAITILGRLNRHFRHPRQQPTSHIAAFATILTSPSPMEHKQRIPPPCIDCFLSFLLAGLKMVTGEKRLRASCKNQARFAYVPSNGTTITRSDSRDPEDIKQLFCWKSAYAAASDTPRWIPSQSG